MSESTVPSGNTPNPSGDQEKEKQFVDHETYLKTVAQEKNAKAKAREYAEELERLKNEKLAAEADAIKRAEEYKKKYEEEFNKRKQTAQTFAQRVLSQQIEAEALKRGCIKPEALMKLVDLASLRDAVDENFTVESTALQRMLDEAQKEHDYLFKKQGVNIHHATPQSSLVGGAEFDFSKASARDLIEQGKKLFK